MRIAEERIEEFRRINNEAYHDEISPTQARTMAGQLLALYHLIMKPLPVDKSATPSQHPVRRTGATF
jgi:hypothetical protein